MKNLAEKLIKNELKESLRTLGFLVINGKPSTSYVSYNGGITNLVHVVLKNNDTIIRGYTYRNSVDSSEAQKLADEIIKKYSTYSDIFKIKHDLDNNKDYVLVSKNN